MLATAMMANRIVAKAGEEVIKEEDVRAPDDGNSEPTTSQNLTGNQAEPSASQQSLLEPPGRTLARSGTTSLSVSEPYAPPLAKLRRAAGSSVPAAFGSIRYPTRAVPCKFVHLAPESSALDVVSLMVDTWKIPSPCALIALNPAASQPEGGSVANAMTPHFNLILRRGLADAAHKTSAWVVSCGERSNEGAHLAGGANVYGANLGYDSPFVAVVAGGRMTENLDDIQNGGVHRYGAKRAVKCGSKPGSPHASPKLNPSEGKRGIELDSHHTHLVIVDGEQEAANGLRDRLEYFISSQDVSGDGVQTPKLLLVVGGDASTLDWVRNGLDAADSATLTAVPALII